MKNQVNAEWQEFTRDIVRSKEFIKLYNKVNRLYKAKEPVLPDQSRLWRPFSYGIPDDVKVIIVGQDPYPQAGVADGLAFSSQQLVRPESLRNVLSELKFNLHPHVGFDYFFWNDLSQWSRQGILLLNSNMTVLTDKVMSHSEIGWQHFIIPLLEKFHDKIFLLWGSAAHKLEPHCDGEVFKAAHPAARDQAFKGCNHFTIVDKLLKERNILIDWILSEESGPQVMIEGFDQEGMEINFKFSKAYLHYAMLHDIAACHGLPKSHLKMDEIAAALQKKTINQMYRYLNPKSLAGKFRLYNELFHQDTYLNIDLWEP